MCPDNQCQALSWPCPWAGLVPGNVPFYASLLPSHRISRQTQEPLPSAPSSSYVPQQQSSCPGLRGRRLLGPGAGGRRGGGPASLPGLAASFQTLEQALRGRLPSPRPDTSGTRWRWTPSPPPRQVCMPTAGRCQSPAPPKAKGRAQGPHSCLPPPEPQCFGGVLMQPSGRGEGASACLGTPSHCLLQVGPRKSRRLLSPRCFF